MSDYDPDSELYFAEERKKRNREAWENEESDPEHCPSCGNKYRSIFVTGAGYDDYYIDCGNYNCSMSMLYQD